MRFTLSFFLFLESLTFDFFLLTLKEFIITILLHWYDADVIYAT